MKHFYFLFTFFISITQLVAMREFDELAYQITDSIRENRQMTPKFIEDWYDNGDIHHIQSVCNAFSLPKDSIKKSNEIRELEDLLIEHKEPAEQDRFHKLMEYFSPNKRESITLLLMNYMIGIPSSD